MLAEHSAPYGHDGQARIETDWLDEVVGYLTKRGLGAGHQEGAELLRHLLELPAREPEGRVTVKRAARARYVHRRTLGRQCEVAGLPSPCRILAFGRVLNAARALGNTGWTVRRVAVATGWPDPFSLSNTMHKMTGLRPSEARSCGLVFLAECWLRRELAAGNARLSEPEPPCCPSCGQDVAPVDRVAEHRP